MPAPVVIPPSQDWDGNDGPWSSFTLQVGTPAQDVKVFVSTPGFQTWVVLPQGCTASDPADCSTLRGGEFLTNQSTTWALRNGSVNGFFELGIEKNLGYTGNGEFGYDTVALGWQGSGGPSLQQQIVAGIATKGFYLGLFGLNPRPTNFSNFDDPVPSFMTNLKSRSMIPSLSWAYTAGNQYRFNKVLASLTLGGYDTSRFIPNDVSFPFNEEDIRDLTVNIERITMTATGANASLLSTSIAAFVDSTVPYIYLPLDVCEKFEESFGIHWNDTVQAYLVDDALHASLLAKNANVTFALSNSSIGHTVDITLPYAAFDLTAEYPLMPTASRYFPLMRAANDTQYTLGRTFLQEAYVTTKSSYMRKSLVG
ncbi:Aspartic peptidase domain [Lasallia pustulata]|uniref:Aspartic peptidase domain n=1 Tax=Lasallia pustulata TaxID=136370 RepID=A0A1W5DBT6_9LECA|nr:Aspartic peptidase domain [Lasallia pustulata]